MHRYKISGVPITDDRGLLVGILTNRDVRFATDFSRAVSDYMVSDGLVTARIGTTLAEAQEILHRHRIEKLPLVDERGFLRGLITYKDILKKQDFPSAKDERGRLLVAAAVGVGEPGMRRAEAVIAAGVDAVAIDTAHGHSKGVLETVAALRRRFPADTRSWRATSSPTRGVRDLAAAGADVVKVGVGAGSICTTRVVSGAGMPQLTAVLECAEPGGAAGRGRRRRRRHPLFGRHHQGAGRGRVRGDAGQPARRAGRVAGRGCDPRGALVQGATAAWAARAR
jgi:IMP dehydrogenase